jgi:hypothetical protein
MGSLEIAASSRLSFMDLLLELALCVIEGGRVMGTDVSLWMFFYLDAQSVEGGGLGSWVTEGIGHEGFWP